MNRALLPFDLDARRAAVRGALAPLADSLSAELSPWLARSLPIPERKARLTRRGGRCPRDGALLTFDPERPHEHPCPLCGLVQRGIEHDDWWAMGAQLWTAERAAHAAVLFVLRGDVAHADFALRVLQELTDRYDTWPNRDNVLGPSRPFFSTYLESIWLLNLCHAVALLECVPLTESAHAVLGRWRDRLAQPSGALIATFHEGRSNRQVWNEVALLSASRLLERDGDMSKRLNHPGGLRDLFSRGLLDDGAWYEGENYHLFAHRGLWYGAQLMRAAGSELLPDLERKFVSGFVSPFLGVLPDDTFPSRRDSQYAVSIRQWRLADWCELGLAYITTDETASSRVLTGVLARLYDDSLATHRTGRARSTADAERNETPTRLSRADLSWRALLMARPTLPPLESWHPSSLVQPSQGLAVLRRDGGRTYVALEGGHTGGGHGHPDRLALSLQNEHTRWLEDPGTGSYVDRSLHWYRSTLAHAAPLFNGASQRPVPATLRAYEERGGAGWIEKSARDIAPGIDASRTIVVCDGYLVDILEWTSRHEATVDLPLARAADVVVAGEVSLEWTSSAITGAGGLEDGFDFLSDTACARLDARTATLRVPGHAPLDQPTHNVARAWYAASGAPALWRATAPGPPSCAPRPIHWLRTTGSTGRIIGVWDWSDTVIDVVLNAQLAQPQIGVTTRDGTTAHHARSTTGWHIELVAGHARSSIDLEGVLAEASLPNETRASESDSLPVTRTTLRVPMSSFDDASLQDRDVRESDPGALRVPLGESHYVPTETDWRASGAPAAAVFLSRTKRSLVIEVEARTGIPVVPLVDEPNLLDNERADVNADGVQVYLGSHPSGRWALSWLAVPALESIPAARVTPLAPHDIAIVSNWARTNDGWRMRLLVPLASIPVDDSGSTEFDLIVNERPPERARRRGQLVLSGGGGFGYLRGDRQDGPRSVRLALT